MSGVVQTLIGSLAGIRGEAVFTTPSTYSWTVPAGVTSICVVVIGGGAGTASNVDGIGSSYIGGGGGGLCYKNNISVTPGTSYTIIVGAGGGSGSNGEASSFIGPSASMSAGGGVTNSRSALPTGGDVNNRGQVPGYNDPSGSTMYFGGAGGTSYTYSETETSPYPATNFIYGGIAGGSTIVNGVTYTASVQGRSSFAGVNLTGQDGGGNGFYGAGGSIQNTNPPNGTPSAQGGLGGAARIIWGVGRSFPNNAA
jgi:hypothetical protein